MYTKYAIMAATMCLAALPAHALRITNLDDVTHRVELYGRGEPIIVEVQPDATEFVTGSTQGLLSLVTAQNPKKSTSIVNADGALSGIIGNGRTEGIPADPGNTYVIWPGGRLMIQSRIKDVQGR